MGSNGGFLQTTERQQRPVPLARVQHGIQSLRRAPHGLKRRESRLKRSEGMPCGSLVHSVGIGGEALTQNHPCARLVCGNAKLRLEVGNIALPSPARRHRNCFGSGTSEAPLAVGDEEPRNEGDGAQGEQRQMALGIRVRLR